ncbi:MAG: hypothetical protein K6F53_02240 [Lachnospiraceae bacterium]|nr:hypothetical protein [Lachnospiraceae bacterium]
MSEKRLRGVSIAYKKDGTKYYRSSITHRNKHISLGSYDNPSDAHSAYWEAAILLTKKDLSIEQYSPERILSYRKWVILINFRDNDIYLTAPIYMRANYFEYHLEHGCVLKFSTDDLFYYSKKSIMKRGRHFFVADYGMQVNILNRYGIKNYGVPGRDYMFVNGDDLDFRYENIRIINRYHGVTYKLTKRGPEFTARIHIIGNYTIGRYPSEIEAAIAYNKAIDLLKKNGVKKNYSPNYIEDIPAKEYAEIYSNVRISKKVRDFHLPA